MSGETLSTIVGLATLLAVVVAIVLAVRSNRKRIDRAIQSAYAEGGRAAAGAAAVNRVHVDARGIGRSGSDDNRRVDYHNHGAEYVDNGITHDHDHELDHDHDGVRERRSLPHGDGSRDVVPVHDSDRHFTDAGKPRRVDVDRYLDRDGWPRGDGNEAMRRRPW